MLTKNKTFLITYLSDFCVIQAVLGYFVQTTASTACGIISLSIIVLSFATVIIFYKQSILNLLTVIALCFTLIADFFLSNLIQFENIKVFAMLSFSATQLCYFFRLYQNQKYTREKRILLILRSFLVIVVLVVTIIVLKEKVNALALISMFYFTNLLLNVIYSIIQIKIAPLFAAGLFLFALCDVCVGFFMMPDFLPIPEGSFIDVINKTPLNLPWVFYTPSQTLIAVDIAIKND